MVGQTFGRLTVLERDLSKTGRYAYWLCKCNCEKQTVLSVRGTSLRDGHTRSCGCLQKEITSKRTLINLTNQRFGKLLVLYKDTSVNKECAYWICRCDCGNIISVSSIHLRNGQKSCGCLKSKGEFYLCSLLTELNIKFQSQKTFSDLKGDKNFPLKFDFYLPEQNCIIEFQGIQHYMPSDYFGGEVIFKQQQKYDDLKRKYCNKNNIYLIEIPYTDYDKLNKTYIKERLDEAEKIHGYSTSTSEI